VPLDMRYEQLRELIARIFPGTMRSLAIRWVDEEKEGITIETNRDLQEALHSQEDQILRITINLDGGLGMRLSRSFKAFLNDLDATQGFPLSPPTKPQVGRRTRSQSSRNIHEFIGHYKSAYSHPLMAPSFELNRFDKKSNSSQEHDIAREREEARIQRWKAGVMRGILGVPLLSFIVLPCLIFVIPVAVPYLFVKLVKDRRNRLGLLLSMFLYPVMPFVELIFVVMLLAFIPLWVPVGSLVFGVSTGIGLTFIFAASTHGMGVVALPLLVTASAGIWFGIGTGISILLLLTLIPIAGLLAPLWLPLCCVSWYLLTPALYFDIIEDAVGWDKLCVFLFNEVVQRLESLTSYDAKPPAMFHKLWRSPWRAV